MSDKMTESEIKERLLHWAATWLELPAGPFLIMYYSDPPDSDEHELTCVLCGAWTNGGYASINHRVEDCLHLAAVNHFGGYMSGVYGRGTVQEFLTIGIRMETAPATEPENDDIIIQ